MKPATWFCILRHASWKFWTCHRKQQLVYLQTRLRKSCYSSFFPHTPCTDPILNGTAWVYSFCVFLHIQNSINHLESLQDSVSVSSSHPHHTCTLHIPTCLISDTALGCLDASKSVIKRTSCFISEICDYLCLIKSLGPHLGVDDDEIWKKQGPCWNQQSPLLVTAWGEYCFYVFRLVSFGFVWSLSLSLLFFAFFPPPSLPSFLHFKKKKCFSSDPRRVWGGRTYRGKKITANETQIGWLLPNLAENGGHLDQF